MLDFSKAFDTVTCNRLLNKLKFYGIQGKIYDWLSIWLMQRTQHVVLDGFSSNYVKVESGVLQGTVLGPMMFLLYINDINVGISSFLRLFADYCVLYRIIESDRDQNCLQSDLSLIFAWSQSWQMQFNVNKCVTLRCDRSSQPSSFTYFLDSVPLSCVTKHTYLGVLLTSSMSFSPHINNIVAKASKMLNFIRRNLSKCTKDVKSTAYLSLVRPILEYSSPVWDPYLLADT